MSIYQNTPEMDESIRLSQLNRERAILQATNENPFTPQQMDESLLLSQAIKVVYTESSALNDIEISRILLNARKKGLDGRKILWEALNLKYRNSKPTENHQNQNPSIGQSGYHCPNCKKEFKSQAALSGHGINRCKG